MFHEHILNWYQKHGRKNLPWQHNPTPYRVWISEIMLQQTQVTTVIPYYQRFMQQFPTVKQLAMADEDKVLHLWSGLGYYSRARNLHKCAKVIHQSYQDQFPNNITELMQLPGIGRSTSAAILSLAFEIPAAILDGNVKRVLTRYHAITEWPGQTNITQQLWEIANNYLSTKHSREYTQAIMDLGATVCTRSKPKCDICPLANSCQAKAKNLQSQIPQKKPKKQKPTREIQMLLISNAKQLTLLQKRPPTGIWGGLWSFLELAIDQDAKRWCQQHIGPVKTLTTLSSFTHTFSHFQLTIHPRRIAISRPRTKIMDTTDLAWYDLYAIPELGLAKPVKDLLATMMSTAE